MLVYERQGGGWVEEDHEDAAFRVPRPAGPCGSAFNLTGAIELVFGA